MIVTDLSCGRWQIDSWDGSSDGKTYSPKLTPDEKEVMDNFLQRMKELGAIVSDEQLGTYRFLNQLHALYFPMESQRAKQEK